MKYSELISFNPIESVIQINEADDQTRAGELVETYVMSNYMVDNIKNNIVNQLQFDEVVDNKGILIIGNYGTGKSHLMSVISSIAENDINLEKLRNEKSRNDLRQISGKFEVLRIEIGAVKMSLRNIILTRVQEDLLNRGLLFNFQSESDVTNNKDIFRDFMGTFSERYPDKGYLIVVDELLDYLLSRKEQEIKLDLGFMRELGEFIKVSKFRVIFGLQEKLFDNPKFSFVSSSLNRVKDRFEQAIIRKEDTAFVVTERILKKDPIQRTKVRKHLEKFCNLYTNMSERLDTFVDMFPIHPAYIEIFSNIHVAENRHILKNISEIIRGILENEVNPDRPCIISYDSYWKFIKGNPAYRTDPNIREVSDKSEILEGIVEHSFTKKAYKPLAKQVIHALSVHRLTTGDINMSSGLTSENLKDDLCLYHDGLPEYNSEFLLGVVQTTLKELMLTVNGQFIENNISNGQYFLDLKKDIDFDAKITQKASVIDDEILNRYYFDIIFQSLDWDQTEYVTNYRIYEHSLIWESKQIFRSGYLFLGTPENRPTAQPPEDYYIYFIPPFGDEKLIVETKDDEIFLNFKPNDEFINDLRFYAASLLLKDLAEESYKATYNNKAINFRKKLTKVIYDNRFTIFDAYYRKQKHQLIELLGSAYQLDLSLKESIEKASSTRFDEYFRLKYPKYPNFKTRITSRNISEVVRSSLDHFAGRPTKLSREVLDSFSLLVGDQISIEQSPIATFYRNKLMDLPNQSVLNFNDLFVKKYNDFLDKEFLLSNEMLSIILVALVYSGDANIKLKNDEFLTASNLEIIPRFSLIDIIEFKFITKPKDLKINELKEFFKVLGIPQGLIINPNDRQKGVEELIKKSDELTTLSLQARSQINDDFSLWELPLMNEQKQVEISKSISKVIDVFSNFKIKFNTVAKLQNFNISIDEIMSIKVDIENVKAQLDISAFKERTISNINYMLNIDLLKLPEDIKESIINVKASLEVIKSKFFNSFDSSFEADKLNRAILEIKDRYISFYMNEHTKMRLDLNSSNLKGNILSSNNLKNLGKLKVIQILPSLNLSKIERELAQLTTCYELAPSMLKTSHTCPKCKFTISGDGISANLRLNSLKAEISKMLGDWNKLILDTLADPLVISQMQFLSSHQKDTVESYLRAKELPDVVDNNLILSLQSLLEGFDPIIIDSDELIKEIESVGPCDIEMLNLKFSEVIQKHTSGKDMQKIRIIIRKKED